LSYQGINLNQIPNPKYQVTNKFQLPNVQTAIYYFIK